MTRTVTHVELESRTKRAELEPSPVPYWREIVPGLHIGFRKGPKHGQWVARWYLGSRQYKHATINTAVAEDREHPANGTTVLDYAQAVRHVRELHEKATRPTQLAGPLTVKQACSTYVDYLRAHKKTADDAEQRIAKHVLPKLGDRQVNELTLDELKRWQRSLIKRDPEDLEVERRSKDTANRLLTSLKAALNQAFLDPANHITSDVAWRRVKPFKGVGRRREVFLEATQSKRLVNVCEGAFRRLVTAALLTGARPPHELATLRVRDFQAELGALSVIDGKTGARDIILTNEAVRFFGEIAASRAPDAQLLPKDDGAAWGKNHHIRPMRDAVEKVKLPEDCTIYALRHTHASLAILNGANLKLLAENLGTSITMLEKHYGNFLAASRRKLIEATGPRVGLKPGKVVEMAKAR